MAPTSAGTLILAGDFTLTLTLKLKLTPKLILTLTLTDTDTDSWQGTVEKNISRSYNSGTSCTTVIDKDTDT